MGQIGNFSKISLLSRGLYHIVFKPQASYIILLLSTIELPRKMNLVKKNHHKQILDRIKQKIT
jgi:hypothetical protein